MIGRTSIISRKVLFSEQHGGLSSILRRAKSMSTPINKIIMFVPQQEVAPSMADFNSKYDTSAACESLHLQGLWLLPIAWVVERMGKFFRILEPGLNVLVPIIDKVKYVQSLKEIAIEVPKQSAVTSDNVTLNIDAILYLRIIDPYLTSYGVEEPEFAITQLAQTTMRSELGRISLDKVFFERESLNVAIVEAINKASAAWGITCLRYEIRDIKLPSRIQEAMQMQVEAERRKRATILESEGVREAEINVAEGKRQSTILQSEAEREERINQATGEAAALMTVAEARAKSLAVVAESLSKKDGKHAASLTIAEKYVEAFQNLAKTSNTLILPNNAADVTNVVSQAFAIYRTLVNKQEQESQASIIAENVSEQTPIRIADICTEKSETKEDSFKSSPPTL